MKLYPMKKSNSSNTVLYSLILKDSLQLFLISHTLCFVEKNIKRPYDIDMKNLITCAFAFKEGYKTSKQINKQAGAATTDMYLKNIFVALTSAQRNNPDDDVCLSVNIDIDEDWKSRFENAGIIVRKMDFDSFVVPKEFLWSLAFFKMCVLNTWVNEGNYDRYLILDADTYTTHSYDDMWKEADLGIILYPLGHDFSHPDRDVIRKDFERLCPKEASKLPITHYGGEYICGNREMLKTYMDTCLRLFDEIAKKGFKVEEKIGDESLWSIAASLLGTTLPFVAATPYIFRFWTTDFYLVSTQTVSNPVSIWHLPQEKETGFITMYEYFQKKKSYPTVEDSAKIFGIVKAKRPFNIYTLRNKINGKLGKWKMKK